MTQLSHTSDPLAKANIPDAARPQVFINFRTERDFRTVPHAAVSVLRVDARWNDRLHHTAALEVPVTIDSRSQNEVPQPERITIDLHSEPEVRITALDEEINRLTPISLTTEMRNLLIVGILEEAKNEGVEIDADDLVHSLDPVRYLAEPSAGDMFRHYPSPLTDLPQPAPLHDFASLPR